MAHVDDLHDERDISPCGEIPLHQLRPTELLNLADLRVAVAGKVDEVECLCVKEVDGSSLAGLGADAREGFAVAQLIDQRGLAHVGAAGKDHVGAVVRAQLRAKPRGIGKFNIQHISNLEL